MELIAHRCPWYVAGPLMGLPTLETSLSKALQPLALNEVLRLSEGEAQVLDVREPGDFLAAHLAGAVNVALSGKFATWCGTVLDRDRHVAEFRESRVPGAVNLPLPQLRRRMDEVPQGDMVVHCAGDYRSTIAVSLLAGAGRRWMRQLIGGMSAWERVSAES